MTVIAMTREMGSLGKDVARQVAAELGLQLIHNEVVEHHLAERLHVRESLVHQYLEGRSSLVDGLRIDKRALAIYTAEEIYALAQDGDVLIRGWGATQLLRPVAHVLCLRVCAPIETRLETMSRRLDTQDRAFLLRQIRNSDAAHGKVTRRLRQRHWRDPALYDLVLNTERVAIERCVDLVLGLATDGGFRPTPESRATLEMLRRQARERGDAGAETAPSESVDAMMQRSAARPAAASRRAEDHPTRREERDLLW
jgi:cytidylate kinase